MYFSHSETSGPISGGAGGGARGQYDTGSPVYQAMQADQSDTFGQSNPTTQSRSFKMLQQMTNEDNPDYGKISL